MPIERARTIDSLAEEVADADIVFSADAPLTLALDRRARTPKIGRVAATPRSHASGEFIPQDDRKLFFELVADSERSWKTIARELDLCLQSWDYTGRVDAILESPEFDTDSMRKTVDTLRDAPSSYCALSEHTTLEEQDVRVIDEANLSELDRTILPDDASAVDPFTDGTASLPEVHRYASATAIVDALVSQITPETASQVGIVLDQATQYGALIEAEFEAAGIPYQGGPGFLDDDGVRLFLRLLQSLDAGSGLTVGEVRPFLTAMGYEVDRSIDEQRVAAAQLADEHADFARLEELRATIAHGTFVEAIDAFADAVDAPLYELRDELASLGISDEPVTESGINRLVYYLRTFEVPVERASEGVLLANASSTAYVDRPVVFYVGLGEGWARAPPDYPWVDEQAFIERDLSRFKRLVQNGQQRYLLVQEARAGERVTPCPYLHEVIDVDQFEGLWDLPATTEHIGATPCRTGSAFESPESMADPDPIETVSQSALNSFVQCPRNYYFGQLLDTPTNYYMVRGNILHEAAELYVNEPSLYEDPSSRERVLAAAMERIRPYVSENRQDIIRTRFDVGFDVIQAFLTEHPPQPADYETYGRPFLWNGLAESLGIEVESPLCERWFESSDLGGRGVVDLLADPQTIVDYKSGSVNDVSTLLKKASLEDIHQHPDFQMLLYLAQHRRETPDQPLEMRFVYPLGAVTEIVKGADPDLEEFVTTIQYFPASFNEFVASREVYNDLTSYADSNDRRRVLDPLGYDTYRDFFESNRLPREGEDPERRTEIRDRFESLATAQVGDYQYVSNGVEQIFDDLADTTGYLLESDLDRFETFLQERIDDINACRESRFPVLFGETEPRWDWVDHRDLILKGER